MITPLKRFKADEGKEAMEDLLGLDRKKIGYIPFDEKLRKIIIEKDRDEEEGGEEGGEGIEGLKDIGTTREGGEFKEDGGKNNDGVEVGGRGRRRERRRKRVEEEELGKKLD